VGKVCGSRREFGAGACLWARVRCRRFGPFGVVNAGV
jgi:hypothetical protein